MAHPARAQQRLEAGVRAVRVGGQPGAEHQEGPPLARGVRVLALREIVSRNRVMRIDSQELLIERLCALRIALHKLRISELVDHVFVVWHEVRHLRERLLRLFELLQIEL